MPKSKTILLWFPLLLIAQIGVAQQYDAQWAVGQPIAKMDFRNDTLITSVLDTAMPTFITIADICDRNGNLLFWTNGLYIANRTGALMVNGDQLSYPSQYYNQFTGGMSQRQGVIILPKPGDTSRYYLFHYSPADTLFSLGGYESLNLYYSIVDMSLDSGLGAVVQKNIPIIQDELLSYSRLAACKHANGRDWWIVKPAWHENVYYKFLLTPDGLLGPFIQEVGPRNGIGNEQGAYSSFSPDGKKYVTSTSYSYIVIMDFDRCTGIFSNPDSIYNNNSPDPINHPNSGGWGVFSPNGRFLYITNSLELNQYDLWSSNINDSVRIETLTPSSDFYDMSILQLAPNGKIYISCYNGGSSKIHVINQPDSLGLACDLQMYGQTLPSVNPVALPYFPNYRLGPLPGSGCDTLPSGITASSRPAIQLEPNPARSSTTLIYEPGGRTSAQVTFYDALGQPVLSLTDHGASGRMPIDVSALPAGVYIVRLSIDDVVVWNTKLVIEK